MTVYYRPLVQHGRARPDGAVPLAGGPLWFTHAQVLRRGAGDGAPGAADIVAAQALPSEWLENLTAPRAALAGLDLSAPRIMGILNVTPDSFSDGGQLGTLQQVQSRARRMMEAGVDLLDIGGESTRPGAATVPVEAELDRVMPAVQALQGQVPLSIDTRKAPVADAALLAGAALINDVSGLTYDPAMAPLCARQDAPVCVMHAQGDPATMQQDPQYDDVLLDVYDWLAARLAALEAQGIPRARVLVDPGIGFGKTEAHNLTLLQNLSLFHGLGAAILLGVSRKRFIGTVGKAPPSDARFPGSVAVGLAGLAQGVQMLRVHDVEETVQALRLWQAVR